ncbi:MAG: hypothetical protein J5I91_04230 [Bacteroidetes bacterium]|nr:hypothetical protein [Bacteroidota bacterium]
MKSKTSKLIIFILFLLLLVGIGLWLNSSFDKGYSSDRLREQNTIHESIDSSTEVR